MTTQASLKRILLRRAPSADAIEVRPVGPFVVEVRARPAKGLAFEQAKQELEESLRHEGTAGVLYNVAPLESVSETLSTTSVSASLHLASFASDQTRSGLRETLVRAVPTLGRAIFEEEPGKGIRILVAHEDGTSSQVLVDRVRCTLEAVGYAGLPFTVGEVPQGNPRNDVANAGFFLPRRDTDIVKLTEEDEEIFATRIRKLVDGTTEDVPLVDQVIGTRLLATPTLTPPLPLPCLLPFYDRVFLEMPPWDRSPDYFRDNFATTMEDFLAYCELGRVVPIFKFNLGIYPRKIVEPWLTNYDLPFVSPRSLDYVAMRYIWTTSPHLRALREDRELAAAISDVARSALMTPGPSNAQRVGLWQLLSWFLNGSESFEGVAWHRGHLALANLSSGGPLAHLVSASPGLFKDTAHAQTASIETFGVVRSVALAQAFDASLTEGMTLNEGVLQMVLPLFKDANHVLSPGQTTQLATLIESLDLDYSGRIPAKEFLGVLDLAETRRIREITYKLLGEGPDRASSLELRDRVQALNAEVARIDRNAIETAGVDVVGDLAKVGEKAATASGGPMTLGFKLVSELLQLPILKRIGGMAFEKVIDDTRAGDALDRLRGAVNGVSPEAIRVYRLRKKLLK
jgi:hypothetical protein